MTVDMTTEMDAAITRIIEHHTDEEDAFDLGPDGLIAHDLAAYLRHVSPTGDYLQRAQALLTRYIEDRKLLVRDDCTDPREVYDPDALLLLGHWCYVRMANCRKHQFEEWMEITRLAHELKELLHKNHLLSLKLIATVTKQDPFANGDPEMMRVLLEKTTAWIDLDPERAINTVSQL